MFPVYSRSVLAPEMKKTLPYCCIFEVHMGCMGNPLGPTLGSNQSPLTRGLGAEFRTQSCPAWRINESASSSPMVRQTKLESQREDVYVCVYGSFIYIYTYMYMYIHICACVCVQRAYMDDIICKYHIHADLHIVCMQLCMYACIHACIHSYVNTHSFSIAGIGSSDLLRILQAQVVGA